MKTNQNLRLLDGKNSENVVILATGARGWGNTPSSVLRTYFPSRGEGHKGFTLIELLVVVLIIGILAAVALPQYEKTVEKARMTEAIMLVRAIANANQVFFMENGRYAGKDEILLLDVEFPGQVIPSGDAINRLKTNYFVYSPGGSSTDHIAVAQRIPYGVTYYLYVLQADPTRLHCSLKSSPTAIQRKLCEQLDATGTL